MNKGAWSCGKLPTRSHVIISHLMANPPHTLALSAWLMSHARGKYPLLGQAEQWRSFAGHGKVAPWQWSGAGWTEKRKSRICERSLNAKWPHMTAAPGRHGLPPSALHMPLYPANSCIIHCKTVLFFSTPSKGAFHVLLLDKGNRQYSDTSLEGLGSAKHLRSTS